MALYFENNPRGLRASYPDDTVLSPSLSNPYKYVAVCENVLYSTRETRRLWSSSHPLAKKGARDFGAKLHQRRFDGTVCTLRRKESQGWLRYEEVKWKGPLFDLTFIPGEIDTREIRDTVSCSRQPGYVKRETCWQFSSGFVNRFESRMLRGEGWKRSSFILLNFLNVIVYAFMENLNTYIV